jgi:Amt family ammonium transporter
MLERFKIDDPVNVIATHGFTGIWGALATGVMGKIPDNFHIDDRGDFILVQIVGVLAISFWALAVGGIVFYILKKLGWLRVSPKHEVLGLNMTEHNAKLPWTDIIETITKIHSTGNLKLRIPVEHSSEAGVVAEFINRLLMELEEREQVLEKMATTDRLTGVYNRVAFEKLLAMEEGEGRYTIGVLDIDKFKKINDTYGHQAGDMALKLLVDILRDELGPEDYIIRWGGEEFLIFMKNRTLTEGAHKMERIRIRVENNIFPIFKKMTVSVGVSAPLHPLESFEEVFKRADNALYCAKNSGRNQVCIGLKDENITYSQFVNGEVE